MKTIDNLFQNLEERQKIKILRLAGISDDRPSILRNEGGRYDEAEEWMNNKRQKIVRLLPRFVDFTDNETAIVFKEDLLFNNNFDPIDIRFIPLDNHQNYHIGRNQFLLPELVLTSVLLNELMVEVGKSLNFSSEDFHPPVVTIKKGSINFSVGGGILASGTALIIACASGLVAAPVIGIAGGSVLASLGAIDLAINWREKIQGINKTRGETALVTKQGELLDLEKQKKSLEIKKLEVELSIDNQKDKNPPSVLVPLDVVQRESERLGLDEGIANHILNKGLPKYLEMRRYVKEVKLER